MSAPTPSEQDVAAAWATIRAAGIEGALRTASARNCQPVDFLTDTHRAIVAAIGTAHAQGRASRDAEVAELRAEVERLRRDGCHPMPRADGGRVIVIGDADAPNFHARLAEALREERIPLEIPPALAPDTLRRLEEMATAALPPKSGTNRAMRRDAERKKP